MVGVSVLQDFAKLFSHVRTLGGDGCAPSFCHLKVHLSFPPGWGQCQTFVAFWQPSFDLNCKATIVHRGTKDSWKGPSPRIQEITPLNFWSPLEKWFCLRAAAQLKAPMQKIRIQEILVVTVEKVILPSGSTCTTQTQKIKDPRRWFDNWLSALEWGFYPSRFVESIKEALMQHRQRQIECED